MEKILVTQSAMPPFEEYIEMIRPLWDSRWLTNMGDYHKELEQKLTEYLGVENVSLTVNGHMALELAIQSMGFPEGAEVITTPYTFISTTHAILRNKLKPVFCDIKEDFTIDESKIEELITEKTVAIIPVHVYGNICNVDKIQEIAFKYDLKVIYDAAHAFGETYRGKNIAIHGDMSIFSFHATKVFHSVEGGAVCCRSQEQWDRLYNLKNFGIRSQELVVAVGANAKMNEFQAAMGLCNLRYLSENIQKRKKIARLYREKLGESPQMQLNTYS
ncbi:MAG: DegT/DnrJ/EryC1/StrS family aminotransferase, partial [Lachnospiraceae bacterium]|nr:DegT/DnrJ/EryC1/StrS family aminotransferase [Lachnospiraceae bacterium]